MSNAEDIFNGIRSVDDIKTFVENETEESLYLDFKQAIEIEKREGRKMYSRVLSGFSNADGGVVIWGVSTKRVNNIDVASECKPIAGLKNFINRLSSNQSFYVNPTIDGILHKPIYIRESDRESEDSGYAITYVPYSEEGPHMAKGGEGRYYKRTSDEFQRMEHYEVKNAFSRTTTPKLYLKKGVIVGGTKSGDTYTISLSLTISNTGRCTAKYPIISISINAPYRICNRSFEQGLRWIPGSSGSGLWNTFCGTGDDVIFPGIDRDVVALELSLKKDDLMKDIEINYKLGADNSPIIANQMILSGAEIKDEIMKYWGQIG